MARMRMIKPEFFRHEDLCELSPLHRLLFQGLWCLADRCGRLRDRPRQIKLDVLPWDECDVDQLLSDLARHGFVLRYTVGGEKFLCVPSFTKHQKPHKHEPDSTIPGPDGVRTDIVRTKPDNAGMAPAESESESESEKYCPSDTFGMFWETYPRREKRPRAERAWAKVKQSEVPKVLASIERWKCSRRWSEGFIPHPATWLNDRGWEDVPPDEIAAVNSTYAGTKEWLTCAECQQDYARVIGKPDEHQCAVAV